MALTMDVRTLATMLAALLAPLALAGCSGTTPAAGHAAESASDEYQVQMLNVAFKPAQITVPVGATVTWTNKDSMGHTVTPEDEVQWGGEGSGDDASQWMQNGKSWSHTFTAPGTYHYYCKPHASMSGGHAQGMVGTVIVE